MKKLTSKLLLPFLALTLSSCAFFEFKDNEKNMVDMGDGEKSIKWNLVENNNEYHPVQTAYFEVKQSTFKYYEDGTLKKEGSIKAVHHGLDHETRPLTIRLDFGYDDNHLDVYDEFMCYTEDEKENLHQFTIMAMGYHIKPLRNGGVPIRDYHLSEMPYAFGTFVKESTQRSTYQNKDQGKVTIATRLKGTFLDEAGNKFYFLNNRYFNKNGYYFTSSKTYFRYENNVKNIFLEGTIYLSYTEESGNKTAVIRVMHGDSEPAEERGVVIEPDYRLLDFDVTDEYVLSFSKGDYFFDRRECDWNPNDFIAGSYTRQTN